jgi:hypothetical protein
VHTLPKTSPVPSPSFIPSRNATALKVHVFSDLASWLSNSHIDDLRQETVMPERQVAECRRLWQTRPMAMPFTPCSVSPDIALTGQASSAHAFATPEVSKTFCYGMLRPTLPDSAQRAASVSTFEPPVMLYNVLKGAPPTDSSGRSTIQFSYQFTPRNSNSLPHSLIHITKTS